ncbi:MAG: DUF1992 domain-containing protein [Proteobacteria bacterium]|nr:DUF1992 domain-containing protein [Pseudomonadota bacterium]
MHSLDWIAEQKIAAAAREGAFDGLPGEGRPLPPDAVADAPEHLRLAIRVLKNAGYVPPEIETRREMAALLALVTTSADDAERRRAVTRLALLEAKLEAAGRSADFGAYRTTLLGRLAR